jgi:hypothetical protein
MSIPISHVVDVNLSLAANPVALAGFGKLLMVTDETSSTMPLSDRIRTYGSIDAVEADWAVGSEVHAAASAYYAQSASQFAVGLASSSATAGKLTGGLHSDLAALQAITAGGFTISVDGAEKVLAALDFASITTMAEVATVIDTALASDATCTYVEESKSFVITSATAGLLSKVSLPSADVQSTAVSLGLSTGTVFDGTVAESPAEALAAINSVSEDFYGVVLNRKWRDSSDSVDVATWVEARTKMFFNTSNDGNCLTTATSDIMSTLKGMTLDRTLSTYSSTPAQYPSASVAGRAFIVNFEGTNTTITLNLKQGPTISVEDLTLNQKLNLEAKNGNGFVVVSGINAYSDSRLSSGKWFDTIHGTDWLQNRIETDVFNVLYQSTDKIPYTDSGVSVIRQAVEGGLRQSVTNGLVAPGNDLNGVFMPLGYEIDIIPVSDVSPSDKGNRVYKGISFRAAGAGAIHKVIITGTFNG